MVIFVFGIWVFCFNGVIFMHMSTVEINFFAGKFSHEVHRKPNLGLDTLLHLCAYEIYGEVTPQ